jgi:hypothetical protein
MLAGIVGHAPSARAVAGRRGFGSWASPHRSLSPSGCSRSAPRSMHPLPGRRMRSTRRRARSRPKAACSFGASRSLACPKVLERGGSSSRRPATTARPRSRAGSWSSPRTPRPARVRCSRGRTARPATRRSAPPRCSRIRSWRARCRRLTRCWRTEGPHPYLIGEPEGRSVLDAVSAARRLDAVKLENRTVVWGHSQGGGAALWTGILAPRYAPDANVIGVAAIAPASDLPAIFAAAKHTAIGKIHGAYVISAYQQDLSRRPRRRLHPPCRTHIRPRDGRALSRCRSARFPRRRDHRRVDSLG